MEEGHYHFHAEPLQRSKGHSSLAAAAYRAGVKLHDERTVKTHDYRNRKGVVHAEILAPDDAPDWALDREQLWNRVEASERRKDAQPSRMLDLALPHQLSPEKRLELVRDFVRTQFVNLGMVADIAIHAPHGRGDDRNHHAHVMLTMRKIDGRGFDRVKTREWNSNGHLEHWREQWATYQNTAFKRERLNWFVDHRSYEERGVEKTPTIKEGRKRRALEAKGVEPPSPERAFTDREMKFVRGYAAADEKRRRWMRHPKSHWARARRGVMCKSRGMGDRIWENFSRARSNYRNALKRHDGLRAEIASAKQEAFVAAREHARAVKSVDHVFIAAFRNPGFAKSRFEEFARRKTMIVALEKMAKQPGYFGRRNGFSLFGKSDRERQDGDCMLKFLDHRACEAVKRGRLVQDSEDWLTRLRNDLERATGQQRVQYESWRTTLNRYRMMNASRQAEWKRIREARDTLRMEQDIEIAKMRRDEEGRIMDLEARGRFEEAAAKRQNMRMWGQGPATSRDENIKRYTKTFVRHHAKRARELDKNER